MDDDAIRGMVKNLPLLRGARHSLFSEVGIAAQASCHSYCILIYSQTNSSLLFSTTERRTVPKNLSFAAYYIRK